MAKVTIKLQEGLRQVIGTSLELNESKTGKVISYNKETGEAIVEVDESIHVHGSAKFSNQDQLNS